MAAKGASKKSKKGGKAKKSSKAAFKKQKASGATPDPADEAAARKRNPRAFVNATRGKTIKLNARKAERDQRRMHGKGRWSTHACIVQIQLHGFATLEFCDVILMQVPLFPL